jgi:hypothetical protein
MAERWRFYLAGLLHAAGGLWLAGWALSHWVASLMPVFGPTGWMPVPAGLGLMLLAVTLLLGGAGHRAGRAAPDAGTPNPNAHRTAAAGSSCESSSHCAAAAGGEGSRRQSLHGCWSSMRLWWIVRSNL